MCQVCSLLWVCKSMQISSCSIHQTVLLGADNLEGNFFPVGRVSHRGM